MSRHVARIGLRPLHQLSIPLSTTTTGPRNRILSSAFSTSPGRIAARCLRDRSSARFSSSALSTIHDVATKDTSALCFGSTASVDVQWGLKRAYHQNAGHTAYLDSTITRRQVQIFPLQRRHYTAKPTPSQGARLSQTQQKLHYPETRSSETSKAASENLAGSKTLLDRLPALHRPTKEELLSAATGFWHRASIRFKWFSIRSFRPYTSDEIGAFISWVFLGHVIWIVIGTTTFVSLGIWALNTVFAQETLAGWVGNYLTKSSGIKIVFESAIVPTWKSGVITFNNVFVSRRPGQHSKKEQAVIKGSSTTAAAAAEAAMAERARRDSEEDVDDGNYSQFDVTINTVNVTLSFSKWFNGKGLLRDVEILGVRGVIDRTAVKPTEGYVDPKSYRHEHLTGDFEIDNFKMADVLLTVHQPMKFRPFTVSVFNCDLPRLRKQWLFYDFMSANNMSGSFDESLFTVHPRQLQGIHTENEEQQWKKHSRLRIDGLNIDHLNRGVVGPFSWIHEGNVDIVADVSVPPDDDSAWLQSLRKSAEALGGFYDRVEATVSSSTANAQNASGKAQPPDTEQRPVVLDLKIHLNDVRASVPLFPRDLTYISSALIRPIVAYINSRRAFIPVNCTVVKNMGEFDGSWTVFDSGLLDDVSKEVYGAFVRDVADQESRKRRMKKVGVWTLRLVAEALFLGLAGQLA